MVHYIVNFIVYTLAMIGILIVAYLVYKKTMMINPVQKNSMLKIVDMMRLPDRKILYVVKCKGEEFLLASSNENVSLISKLDTEKKKTSEDEIKKYLKEKEQNEIERKAPEKKVIKSLLKELSDKNRFRRGNY